MNARFKSFIPNAFTFMNFTLGFCALVFSIRAALESNDADYVVAAMCVFVASGCDVLDGLSARYFNVDKEFGKILDSLSDLLSFGIVPAVMFYTKFYASSNSFWLIFFVVLFPLNGVMRLAKFHVLKQEKFFVGLPIPIAAVIVVLFMHFNQVPDFFGFLTAMNVNAPFHFHESVYFGVFVFYACLMNTRFIFPKITFSFSFAKRSASVMLVNIAVLCLAIVSLKLLALICLVVYSLKPVFAFTRYAG